MRPGRAGWWALGAAGASLMLSLLLAAGAPAAAAATTKKRSFGLRVHSHDRDLQGPTFRRSLLRNTTMPLHGAVKDYGCVLPGLEPEPAICLGKLLSCRKAYTHLSCPFPFLQLLLRHPVPGHPS